MLLICVWVLNVLQVLPYRYDARSLTYKSRRYIFDSNVSPFFCSFGRNLHDGLCWAIGLDGMSPDFANGEKRGVDAAQCALSKAIWILPPILLPLGAFFFSRYSTLLGTKFAAFSQLFDTLDADLNVITNKDGFHGFPAINKFSTASGFSTPWTKEMTYSSTELLCMKLPPQFDAGLKARIHFQNNVWEHGSDCLLSPWSNIDYRYHRSLFTRVASEFRNLNTIPGSSI